MEGQAKSPHAQAIAVFDFDGTLITGDSIVRYLRYAIRQGKLSVFSVPRLLWLGLIGKLGLMSAEEAKSRSLSFLMRMSSGEQELFNRAFCREELAPRLYVKGLTRMKAHQERGEPVILLSASPSCYLKYMRLHLPVTAVLASPTDRQGRVSLNLRGQQKRRHLQQWTEDEGIPVDWENSSAYGNSASDLPVMRLCGHALMVNPKPAMRRQAADLPEEDWKG